MALPKALQLDDEGYLCDERGILMRYDREVAQEIVRRYNTYTALKSVYDEVQRLRSMGYIYTNRVVDALDACEAALRESARP